MSIEIDGLFWNSVKPKRIKKEEIKRLPPEPVWEHDGYLPGLEEARVFKAPAFSIPELVAAHDAKEILLFDVECSPNWFYVSFMSFTSGKTISFSLCEDNDEFMDLRALEWIVKNFCIVGFNSRNYDIHIIAAALAGWESQKLYWLTEQIIGFQERGYNVLKKCKVPQLKVNHIDLIEVAPLEGSLKLYAARLHAPTIEDLPFKAGKPLNLDQRLITIRYNYNDLVDTAFVFQGLLEQIQLRDRLSLDYGQDLRSKSDAQVAEAIISSQVASLNGNKTTRPNIKPGTLYSYHAPDYIYFATPGLQELFSVMKNAAYCVAANGSVKLPAELEKLKIVVGNTVYKIGIGGLHSSEQKQVYYANDLFNIYDRDVVSYYPRLILNSKIFPKQMGPNFLKVYDRIVTRRVEAKAAGDKITADSLKITANGTFGKLGSLWSLLYSPDLLIWVTITGQLSLLMLIERLEYLGISVVSANTDGIVIYCRKDQQAIYERLVKQWEVETGLETEESIYRLLASRDVNNYIAVKPDGSIKAKGAYLNPWADPKLAIFRFHKNPVNSICSEAVSEYVSKGIDPAQTINNCKDFKKFITVRRVKGGGVKNGEYLGKVVRWYYAQNETGEIVYSKSGNKVARSDGAKPCMTLPKEFPQDIDLNWYIKEARGMLADLGLPGFETIEGIEYDE